VARSITSSPSTYAAGQPPALRGSRTVSQKPAVSTASPAQNAGCSAVTRPKSSSADTSVCRTAYPHRASATASGTRGQAARARRPDHTGGRSDRSVTGSWAGLDDSGEGRDRDVLHSPDASASDACDADACDSDACGADSRGSPGASDDTSGRDDDTSGRDSDAGDRSGAGPSGGPAAETGAEVFSGAGSGPDLSRGVAGGRTVVPPWRFGSDGVFSPRTGRTAVFCRADLRRIRPGGTGGGAGGAAGARGPAAPRPPRHGTPARAGRGRRAGRARPARARPAPPSRPPRRD